MATYTWDVQEAVDRTILKDGKVFRHIRLTPTGVAWRPKGWHTGSGKTPLAPHSDRKDQGTRRRRRYWYSCQSIMAAAQLAEAVAGNRDAIVGGVGRRLRASRVTIERVKTAGRAVERI